MPSIADPTEAPRVPLRRTLRAKWTLALVAVAIVPILVLGAIVLDIQRKGLGRAEKELEAAVVDEAAAGVIQLLDQTADASRRAGRLFADETMDVDARVRALSALVTATPSIAGIAFFDDQGQFVDAFVRDGAPNASGDEILTAAPAAADGFTLAFRPSGTPIVRYQAALTGPVHGTLVVPLAARVLDKTLGDLSRVRFQTSDRVYVVDESLRIIAGRVDVARPPIFESVGWTAKTFGAELVVTSEFVDHGIDKVGTIRTMPRERLALVVERPADEAFAALASARRTFLLAIAGFATLAAIAGALVVRGVLGPIRGLMRLIQRYARRDFAARSDVSTGDELEALGSSLERMADDLSASEQEIAKRARAVANLRRYLPEEAAAAAAEGGTLDLGGAKTRVTILFADVVAFTGFAEKTSPERAVAFLNELFTILSEIVFRHDGMVDKFIGDCIMAVFRPTGSGDDIARALAAAEDMHSFVASNLPRWREAYAFDVELGIGIGTGDVLMGNLGSESRMEYTVIGDAVNVAARLEALAAPKQTLTTKEVVDASPNVAFASLGEHALRGKAHPIEVFEVVP